MPRDPEQVLRKVVALPMLTWRFVNEDPAVRHLGPTAQDFREAFELGIDDKTIGSVDADGVALAAIQGLYAELKEHDATIAELRERVTQLESLRGELAALSGAIAAATKGATVAAGVDTTVH